MSRVFALPALYPRTTLLIAAVVTALAVAATSRLRIDASGEALLLRDSEAWRFLRQTEAAFGGDDVVVVVLRAPDVIAPDVVRQLRALSDAIAAVPGVARTISVATIAWPYPDAGALRLEPLFAPDGTPTSDAVLAGALANSMITPALVSRDRRAGAVLALVANGAEVPGFKRALVAGIDGAVARAVPGADVIVGGAPHALVELDRIAAEHSARLGAIALVAMAVILFVAYGSMHGVWVPLLGVVLSLVWTFAVLALSGRTFGIVSSVLPPLIVAVGASYAIRVLSEFGRLHTGNDARAAGVAAARAVGPAIVLCAATTLIGLSPLLTSRVEALRELGLLSIEGTIVTAIGAMTVIPALLVLWPMRTTATTRIGAERRLTAWMTRVAAFTRRRERSLLVVSGMALLAGMAGLPLLYVDQNFYEWFPPESSVTRATQVLDTALGGANPIAVVLDSPRGPDDLALYRAAAAVARVARAEPGVRSVTAASDYLGLVHEALRAAGDDGDGLPDNERLLAQELLLVDGGSNALFGTLAQSTAGQLRVLIGHDLSSGRDAERLIERLKRKLSELVPAPLGARVTGIGVLRLEANRELTRGMFTQLGLAALAMGVAIMVVLRSVRLGAFAIVTNLFPLLALYGILGFLGVPLNVATVSTGVAALGNTVDDTVQLLARYRRKRSEGSADPCVGALEEAGVPMVISDLQLGTGFGVVTFSSFFPVYSFGMLGSFGVLSSLLANLFVLPPLLRRFDRRVSPAGREVHH